ncbi:MAG: membrane protein insertase YidC [Patescibacteria group bacterium]|nr:membrane protein insertase YidC [Patescibacteria group bacterium]MDE1940896.1 membrane protein insertase YidC [Patescibacteria group bacterium]MDE1967074.1 membrane protein insertase YidC [Patescibacteria group bacterium]
MFTEIVVRPLYNGLVGLMDIIPGLDVGLAVIIFTVIVRLILYPLSKNSLLTQVRMKDAEPEAAKIRAQYANDRQTQAMKIMALYKEKRIKPFSGILLLIIQLPILLALISVFYKIIPTIDASLLYSFVHAPAPNPTLLGIDLTNKNLILSVITAIIQFFQLHFSLAAKQQKAMAAQTIKNGGKPDTAAQLSNSMTTQMKFILPIFAFVSIYWIIPARFPEASSIIAIYWSVSSLFTLGQELYIKKKHLK